MTENAFEKSVCGKRLDRLRGTIVALTSDLEDEGYTNLEIARALLWASYRRGHKEDSVIRESFYSYVRDYAVQILERYRSLGREFAFDIEKRKTN